MNFGWLKRILKQKNLSNANTSDLATIDTSFIRIPKLSKLSKEEKEKVLYFYNKLLSDDDINLVKYSNDLLERANTEREMLLRAMSRYEEQYRFLEDERKKIKQKQIPSIEIYNLGKLSSLEYAIIEKNIMSIRRELELKLVALDMYIKKEEKRKYNFLDVFGRAERIKCFTDKNKLLSERERLLTSIKIDENILTIIRKDIKDNQRLIIYHDLLKELQNDDTELLRKSLEDSMYRFSQKSLYTFKEEFEDEVETEVGYKMEGYSIPIKEYEYVCGEQNHLYAIFRETNGIINEELIKYIFETVRISEKDLSREFIKIKGISKWKDFISIVPDEFLDKIYEIVAKYSHKRDLYVYEHRNDYKDYLQDIKGLIDKCELTSIDEWDSDILREKVKNYTQIIKKYLNIYGNDRSSCFSEPYDDQISPPMEEQLKKNYFKLLFLYTINNGYDDSIFEIFSYSYYSDGFYLTKEQLYNEFVHILNELRVDVFNKYKVMPKYEIEFSHNLETKDKIKEIIYNGEFLYNILNGYYYEKKLYIGVYEDKNNLYNNISLRIKLVSNLNVSLADYYNLSGISNNPFFISDEETMEIEDLYYLLRIVGLNSVIPYICFKNLPANYDLLLNIRWNKVERENDDRIYILPKQIKFKSSIMNFYAFDILNIYYGNIAIYVSNWGQVKAVNQSLKKNKTNIKYLIMTANLYENYKKKYDGIMYPYTIIVPNDTKYVELSKYLDEELLKEQEQQKVLKKKL